MGMTGMVPDPTDIIVLFVVAALSLIALAILFVC